MSDVQQQLLATDCWDALVDLLAAQLPQAEVHPITDKDFDQEGQLILTPPAVRVFYAGTGEDAIEGQRTAYEDVHRFLVACGDQDRRGNYDQARASLLLAQQARTVLAGARLQLASGDVTEPVTLKGIETMPVKSLGVAYGVAIEVPGPAVFAGVNAQPAPPQPAPSQPAPQGASNA